MTPEEQQFRAELVSRLRTSRESGDALISGADVETAVSWLERLGLAEGQPVTVFIKATEVILGVEER